MSIIMKCSYCNEIAEFKCACFKSYLCKFHLVVHLNSNKIHPYEEYLKLDESIFNNLKTSILQILKQLKIARSKIALKTLELINIIQKLSKKNLNLIDKISDECSELINFNRFLESDLLKIKKYESREVKYQIMDINDFEVNMRNLFIQNTVNFVKIPKDENFETGNINLQIKEVKESRIETEKNYSQVLPVYFKRLQVVEREFFEYHSLGFECGAITKDGKILVVGGFDSKIRAFDINLKKQILILHGHNSSVTCIAIKDNFEHIFSGSDDLTVRIWSVKQNDKVSILKGHEERIHTIFYSEKDCLIFSADLKFFLIWDFKTQILQRKFSFQGIVYNFEMYSSNDLLITGFKKKILFYDVRSGKLMNFIDAHLSCVRSICISKDQKIIASGSKRIIIVWDLIESKVVKTLNAHNDYVTCLVITSDNSIIVSGSYDNSLLLWSIMFGIVIRKFIVTNIKIIFNINQRFVYAISKNNFIEVDIPNQKMKTSKYISFCDIDSVHLSTDLKLIVYLAENRIKIWDVEKKEIKNSIDFRIDHFKIFEISKDNRLAISCSKIRENNLIIWDLKNGQIIKELEGHLKAVVSAAFNKIGSKAASGSHDYTVRIWDLIGFKKEIIFLGHTCFIISIKFIESKNLLASGDCEKNIIVWNLKDQTQYTVFNSKYFITQLFITIDEEFVISPRFESGSAIWNINEKRLELEFIDQDLAEIWPEKYGFSMIKFFKLNIDSPAFFWILK